MRRIVPGFCLPLVLATLYAVPPAAAQSLRPITVCVVTGGKLQEVTAAYNFETGDTTVNGRAWGAAYPSSAAQYAGSQPWFVDSSPLSIGGSSYRKYGLPRVLGVTEVEARGSYQGVPLFVEVGAPASAEVYYAPVRTGCEFQPYVVQAATAAGGTGGAADGPEVDGWIAVGETRIGSLVHDQPKEDNHHYELWRLRGRAGEVIDLSLESDDFDAYLEIALPGVPISYADDDGGEELDSRLQVALPEDGEYTILVTTAEEEEIGKYTLRLTRPAWATSPGARRVLLAGQDVEGRIVGADIQDGGGKRQEFLYTAIAEETVTFELASEDFDVGLSVGRMVGTRFVELAEDDDGGEGTDSRLEFEFPESGVYVVRVEAIDGGNGDYTLRAGVIPVITLGETVTGEITGREPEIEDGHFSDEFEYVARKGETIVIELSSSDFDVLAYVGEQMDGDFTILASDDDGGGGTNSRLEFTFPEEGFYYIGVTSAGERETGDYTLRVRAR